jgi:S1-C subfamily serine protease
MSALVAALVEQGGPGGGPPTHDSELIAEATPRVAVADWLAAAAAEQPDATGLPGITALAPSAGPGSASTLSKDPAPVTQDAQPGMASHTARRLGTAVEPTLLTAGLDPRVASVVRLDAGSRRGSGVYVAPRLVVTTTDLVEHTSVIDVTTSDGEAALGLVVHTDAERGLAVVHVPRAGRPALLSDAPASGSGEMVEVLELVERGQARLSRAVLQRGNGAGGGVPALQLELDGAAATSTGAPVFLNDRAIALVGAREGAPEGNLVPVQALHELLESEALAALR